MTTSSEGAVMQASLQVALIAILIRLASLPWPAVVSQERQGPSGRGLKQALGQHHEVTLRELL